MNVSISQINILNSPRIKILFLGYGRDDTVLIDQLIALRCEVWHSNEKILSFHGFDLIVSYGYRHIISVNSISSTTAPILNLHISYLPWNRGAHPNFWSFYECTPSGVSIHFVDEGIDTGPIIYQRYVNFPKNAITFNETYDILRAEVEKLFIENINDIISLQFNPRPQRCKGTYHAYSDLPVSFSGWNSNIQDEISRLDQLLKDK